MHERGPHVRDGKVLPFRIATRRRPRLTEGVPSGTDSKARLLRGDAIASISVRIALDDGLRLFVDVDGAGLRPDGATMREWPTLVLLHGGPGFDHSPFKAFFPRVTDAFQVVYYDHRGMGRSDKGRPTDWNLDRWAQDLAVLLERLGIERPILLGQSFGGYVALRYATARRGPLAALVLSSTGARVVPEDCYHKFEEIGGSEIAAIAADFFTKPSVVTFGQYRQVCMPLYNTTPQDPALAERQLVHPEVLIHFWRNEHFSMDLREGLTEIDCPTLVVTGAEDPITPPARSIEVADLLGEGIARCAIVPDAGHGVWRDAPDVFEQLVREFASDLMRSGTFARQVSMEA